MEKINLELSSLRKSFSDFLCIINGINALQPYQLKSDTVELKTGSDHLEAQAHFNEEHFSTDLLRQNIIIREPRFENIHSVNNNETEKRPEWITKCPAELLQDGRVIEEPNFGSSQKANDTNNGKTHEWIHCVYNESESECEVDVVDHVPYTVGTNNELDEVNVDVVEHLDSALIEPLYREMDSEIEVEIVNSEPYTVDANDELTDVIEPNVPTSIKSTGPTPIEELSRQPYRLSIGVDSRHGCDKNEMYVPTSDQGAKKYCCVYCKKLLSKLVPHLQNVHKDEKDVKAFSSLAPGTPERLIIIRGLNILGQNIWNKDGTLNKGMFIPTRRPNPKFPRKAKDQIQ